MGTVFEELTVKNWLDVEMSKQGYIPPEKIRQTKVLFKAVYSTEREKREGSPLDTGAFTNVITEDVAKALGLTVDGVYPAKLVGGVTREFHKTGGLEIWWRNRYAHMGNTLVVPNDANNLLSVVAMEILDIMPDVKERKLVGVHGDEWVCELE